MNKTLKRNPIVIKVDPIFKEWLDEKQNQARVRLGFRVSQPVLTRKLTSINREIETMFDVDLINGTLARRKKKK